MRALAWLLSAIVAAVASSVAWLARRAWQEQAARLALLDAHVATLSSELAESRTAAESCARLQAALAPAPNPQFVLDEMEDLARNPPLHSSDESIARLERNWTRHLNETTPRAFQHLASPLDCADGSTVVVDVKEFVANSTQAAAKAALALVECGFVFLDNAAPKSQVQLYADAYEKFILSKEALKFRYPIQGKGRFEHMIPFAPPFNDSLHLNAPLHATLRAFLRGSFKMELQTVINSPPGHQGWRYLWHEEERTPPYTVVVGIPLSDVTPDMGPTQFCPRRKLRLYHGWHCPEHEVVAAGSSMGTIAVFDYKTLHRGPGNTSNKSRPMVSLVYSLKWFLNSYAYVNRALSLEAALHQRRYWEAYAYHPDDQELLWAV